MVNHATQGGTKERTTTAHVMQEAEPIPGMGTAQEVVVDFTVHGVLPKPLHEQMMGSGIPAHFDGSEKFAEGAAILLEECGYDADRFGQFVRGGLDEVTQRPDDPPEYTLSATYHGWAEEETTGGNVSMLDPCAGCDDPVEPTTDYIEGVDGGVYCTVDCYNEVNT